MPHRTKMKRKKARAAEAINRVKSVKARRKSKAIRLSKVK